MQMGAEGRGSCQAVARPPVVFFSRRRNRSRAPLPVTGALVPPVSNYSDVELDGTGSTI